MNQKVRLVAQLSMETHDSTKCAECLKCIYDAVGMRCASTQCNRYYCSECTDTSTSPSCKQVWTCTECSPPTTRDDSEGGAASSVAQDDHFEKPEVVNLIGDIRRLSRGLMSIKNKLREATLSVTLGTDRPEDGSRAEAKSRIKTLEKRIREIELLRYTVKELRKELNTQSYNYVLNSIEVSLDTTMKIFCALHIMQQKK